MKLFLNTYQIWTSLLLLAMITACKSEEVKQKSNTFSIGIPSDPEKLHPAFNPKSKAREIFQNIFLPLSDYDPETLTLIPILVETIPEGRFIDKETVAYDIVIKENTTWSDGSPLTAYDLTFALKVMTHPQSQTAAWKSFLSSIIDIKIDPKSDKSLTVFCESSSMHSQEVALTLYPFQESRYDPDHYLRAYSIKDWNIAADDAEAFGGITQITDVITAFNHPDTYRKNISHAGRYKVNDWVSNQYISLVKVANHWADSDQTNPYLHAGSDTILFKIIEDENSLATLLKSGGIDMTMYLSPQQYLDLSNDPNLGSNFSFHRIETLKIAFLGLNNRDPELQDVAVRKALSHSMNVGALLEAEENGLGTEVSILVHPSKRYYPHHLPPRKYDIDKAINLLETAGWKDTNGDGIRDKTIDGKFEELVFDFYMSGSQLTQTIALLLQQAGEKVGFELNVIQKNARAYIKDNVITHHYEIAALSDSYNEPDADPYIKWHSESTTQAGRNRSGFTTPELDSIIALIRKENDSDKREEHFKVFCEILYDGTPVIPLFAPVNIIAVDNRYRGVCTSKRPGYMANTFTLQ